MNSEISQECVEETNSAEATKNNHSFKSVFTKFSKKAEKTGFTSSAFFSKKSAINKDLPVPGTVKQVHGAQLPPIWNVPVPMNPNPQSTTSSSAHTSPAKQPQVLVPSTSTSCATQLGESRDGESNPSGNLAPSAGLSNTTQGSRPSRFAQLLSADVVDLEKLRELSWRGIPREYRALTWQLLLGYLPSKTDRRQATQERKRQEYAECIEQYYNIPDTQRTKAEQDTLRQILVDIPRTSPNVPLFHQPATQRCMERILYIWAVRHPASGYVQGMNDLLLPFFVVLLSSYVDDPFCCDVSILDANILNQVEADCYGCLTKFLDGIHDHYTVSQPGLQRMIFMMEELVRRCEADLHRHLVEQEGVLFTQFAFRWMNCLLMREIPLRAIIRLWDTYLAEDGGFENFHVYVCTAILMTFGNMLKEMQFQDLVLFLQNLPTQGWGEDEIDPFLSRAYVLQSYFQGAPNHLSN